MSGVDRAISMFAALPGSSVGRGPRHPTEPSPDQAQRIARFLATYPTLRGDAGYIEFLEKYAGASIENEDFSQIVDILGFTDASTDIEDMDGPIVDNDGFLMIAEAVYHLRKGNRTFDTLQHAFAFDVTGERSGGLYRSLVSGQRPEPDFKRAYESFAAWLDEVVSLQGWLEPPGHP